LAQRLTSHAAGRSDNLCLMSEAFEISADDAEGVAEAIRRAASGSVVHLVRDGRPVADIVPASLGSTDDSELEPAEMAAREDRATRRPAACVTASEFHAERFGAPTLEHYRAVYAQAGAAWPGEAFVRRHYPVADAS
jgi:antitoxin (DNA-binding transcriptional repressor) of toxin-antitoxin stability system